MRRRCSLALLLVLASTVPARSSMASEEPVRPPILVVRSTGGFVPRDFLFTELPTYYVTTAGQLITQGPQIAIFPGPVLPNLRSRQLSRRGVAALDRAARTAGLDAPQPDYGIPPVADAPTTVISVRGGPQHSIEAFGIADDTLTSAQQAARRRVQQFLAQIGRLAGGVEGPYPITAMRLQARVATSDEPVGDVRPTVADWPLASVALGTASECAAVSGPDARRLVAALRSANTLTRWRQGAVVYVVLFRPVFPGERGCTGKPG